MVQYVGLDYDNIREMFNDCGVTVIDLTYEHESGLMMHSIACPCDVDGFDTFRVRYKADDLDNPIYMELINYDYDAIMELCGNPKESPIMLNGDTIRILLDDFEEMQFIKMEHRTVKDVLMQMHQSVGAQEFTIGFDDATDSYYCSIKFDGSSDDTFDYNENCLFYYAVSFAPSDAWADYRNRNDDALSDVISCYGLSSISFTFDGDKMRTVVKKEIDGVITDIDIRPGIRRYINKFLS